jgi:hypothetical protein
MMNWEGFGRKQSCANPGTLRAFVWGCWVERHKTASVPTEMRTQHLQNMSLESYCCANPLDKTEYGGECDRLDVSKLGTKASRVREMWSWSAYEVKPLSLKNLAVCFLLHFKHLNWVIKLQAHGQTDIHCIHMQRVNSLYIKTEIIIINIDTDFSSLLGNEGADVQKLPDAGRTGL